ncbi:phage tail domain-containing protein [Staphylococcus haemolyticus]|uniref:phage tail domain-containing protein n=1 Tax=Staphylococcus haemolyticus TaxID=1283 RepID=UPI00075DA590|nr:phage tail domain-containing protein [Staphylococcus haemolyticus]
MSETWVKIIEDGIEYDIDEFAGLMFLDAKASYPSENENNVSINGIDGVLPGVISFTPFNLVLRFGYDGIDAREIDLFEHHFRSIFHRRKPYAIVTSQMPGIKYSISGASIQPTVKDFCSLELEVTLKVYKGYSESVNTTGKDFVFNSEWMLENGLPLNHKPKYHFKTRSFQVWNGSTDTVDPRMRHKLKILMQINAVGGFQLVNTTTEDKFKYNKTIEYRSKFMLNDVYAYKDNQRVGIDTNRGIITLAPGMNNFEILGDVKDVDIIFEFPFIYR